MNFIEIAQITNLLVGEPIRSLFPENGAVLAPGTDDTPGTFILSGRELSAVRAAYVAGDPHTCEAVRRLVGKANQDLIKPLGSVTQKTAVPPSGDAHDYYSAAKYYWPKEGARARKGVKKHEKRDGLVNPAVYSSDYDFSPLVQTADAALTLAIAGFITSDLSYANRAAELLRTWFLDPATRQNPNFNFGQVIPGEKKGRWQGLIEARNLLYLIDASQLLCGSSAWSRDDHDALKRWFKEFFAWLRTSELGKRAGRRDNNIAMWYDLQTVIYALFTSQRKLAETIMRNSVEPRMTEQIAQDGSQPAEMARARPYDYVVFNLLAMLDLAHVAERMGIDLWALEAKDGANLENALNWLLSVVPTEQLTERLKREADRQRLRHEVDQLQSTVAINQAELDQARTHLAMRERLVAGVREELRLLRESSAADQEEVERLTLEVRTGQDERASLRGQLAAAEQAHADALTQLRTQLAETEDGRAALLGQLAEAEKVHAEVTRLRNQLADVEKRLSTSEVEHTARAKKLQQAEAGFSEIAAGLFALLDQAELERGRALEAQAARIKRRLSYRLGQDLVSAGGSFGGLVRLPVSLWRSWRAFRSDSAKPADVPGNPASPMPILRPTSFLAGSEPIFFRADIPPQHGLRLSGYAVAKWKDDPRTLTVLARYRDAEENVIPPAEGNGGRCELFPDCTMYEVALDRAEPFEFTFAEAKHVAHAEVGFLAQSENNNPVFVRLATAESVADVAPGPLASDSPSAAAYGKRDDNESGARGAQPAKRGYLAKSPVGTDPGAVPKPHPDMLRAEYERKGLHLIPDTFVLFRIIGNDLPPRHRKGQGLENLRFTLENEPELANCEKRWVVNRIVDRDMEQRIIALLQQHGKEFIRIPFFEDEYAKRDWKIEGFPSPGYLYSKEYRELKSWEDQLRVEDETYHYKNLYLMNNNGARNAALRAGREIAKWVLPWDGNCFMTESAWRATTKAVTEQSYYKYFAVPMARALNNTDLLTDDFVPEAVEEPQLVFRQDSGEEFNEQVRYGRRPKVELFYRLGLPGKWDSWKYDPWESKTWSISPEAGQFGYAGWVARLFSGNPEVELATLESFKTRGRVRIDGIRALIDEVDERLARSAFHPDKVLSMDEARLEQQREAWRTGNAAVKPVFDHILASARQALERGPYSVVQKSTVAPSGDPHDYWHPGPYWWPNPDTPDGLPYIKRDGQRVPGTRMYEPDSDKYDRTRLQLMFDDTTSLALAWLVTGDNSFAAHGARLVRTWFLSPETRMNPHMTYSQVRLGHLKNQGPGAGTIEMKDLYYFLDATRLLHRSGAFTEEDRQGLATWLRSYLSWLQESPQGVSECESLNNHGSLYDLQVAAIAAYLDDLRTVLDTLKRSKQRIVQQFEPDGRQPFEMDRPITQHYCAFNLQSWVNIATFARGCGVGLWHYRSSDGRSLQSGLDWTLRHMGRPWPHEQIEPFDEDRFLPLYHAYISAYGKPPAAGVEQVPDMWCVKPVFFPHDGIRPYWMVGA